jgi:hypothetical protein
VANFFKNLKRRIFLKLIKKRYENTYTDTVERNMEWGIVPSDDGIQEACVYIGLTVVTGGSCRLNRHVIVVEVLTIGVSKKAVKRRLYFGAEKQCWYCVM